MNIKIKNVRLIRKGVVEVGDINITGDKITQTAQPDSQIIDGRNFFATPGLVNSHTHASMTLLRSFSDDKNLKDWLEKDIWPIEAKMRRRDIRVGAQLAAVEMIKSGTTAFADMYGPCMEEVAQVVADSGLRGVLSRGLIAFADGDNKLAENVELYKNYHGAADGRITVMLGPHAIYTCPPEFLKKVAAAAAKLGAEIHIHMNETEGEIADCLRTYGKRPFEVVSQTGLFDNGTLAAHCVHLSDSEIEIMKAKKIRVAHNPGSNLKLASGIAPVTKLLDSGITVALGTDGPASNNNLDMLEELHLAALLAKVQSNNPRALSAAQALNMATSQGAKAVGLTQVGELLIGNKADIVLWNMNDTKWQPPRNPLSLLVYSADSSSADTVIVNGKVLMANRRLLTLDEHKIISDFNSAATRLLTTCN